MAKCDFCDREMTESSGCIKKHIEYGDGEVVDSVAYGEETRFEPENMPNEEMRRAAEEIAEASGNQERCHDCGAKRGGVHHPGCDWEECPRCRGQLLSCSCPSPVHHVAAD